MFKSKKRKEFEKRIALKKTLKALTKQVNKLEIQKNTFIKDGREAYSKGMKQQFNLAVAGLKISLEQKKRLETMLMNLKITSQLKDISKLTVDFLEQMRTVSKDLIKITDVKSFHKVSSDFETALKRFSNQTENMESFLDDAEKEIEEVGTNEGQLKSNEAIDLILDGLGEKQTSQSFNDFKEKVMNNQSKE